MQRQASVAAADGVARSVAGSVAGSVTGSVVGDLTEDTAHGTIATIILRAGMLAQPSSCARR